MGPAVGRSWRSGRGDHGWNPGVGHEDRADSRNSTEVLCEPVGGVIGDGFQFPIPLEEVTRAGDDLERSVAEERLLATLALSKLVRSDDL